MDPSVSVAAPTAWARVLVQHAVSIATGDSPVVIPAHQRLLGMALGVALLGFATSLVALIVALLWLCR